MGTKVQGERTFFLFSVPSSLSGIARLLDLGATFTEYNISATEAEADARAMTADWLAVGDDLSQAIAVFGEQHPELKSAA